MIVRELIGLVGVKTDQASFAQGQAAMGGLLAYGKKAMGALAGLFVIKWAKDAVVQVQDTADKFGRLSDTLGINAQELQKLAYAANLADVGFEDLTTSIKKMMLAQVSASEGGKGSADIFKKIGVGVKDADGKLKPASQLLMEVADGFGNLKTDADRVKTSVVLFGKGGAALLPMLKQGSAAIQEYMGELEGLGAVIDDETIEASDRYESSMKRIQSAMFGIKVAIGKEVLPVLSDLISGFLKWWRTGGQVVRQGVAKVFKGIAQVLGNTTSAVGRLIGAIAGFTEEHPAIEKFVAAFALIGAAIMKGPFGKLLLLASLIMLIIDDVETWRKGGKSVTGELIDALNYILDMDVVKMFKSVGETLAWIAEDPIPRLKEGFGNFFSSVGRDLVNVFGGFVPFFATIGAKIVTTLYEKFSGFTTFFVDLGARIATVFSAAMMQVVMMGFNAVKNIHGFFSGLVENISIAVDAMILGVSTLLSDTGNAISGFFSGVWDGIKNGFTAAFDFLTGWVNRVLAVIKTPIDAVGRLMEMFGFAGGKAGAAGGAAGAAGGTAIAPPVPAVFGRPTPAASGATVSNSVNVTVNPAQGMSEEAIGAVVTRKVTAKLADQNRNAMRTLVPAKATL